MKTALVTGSAGLIGRHFCRHLLEGGWEVTFLDVAETTPASARVDARQFFADDEPYHYDLVVHCAAHVGGRLDIERKAAFIGAYNVQLDGALFEWALRAKPGHVIYWSSSAAYPVRLQDDAVGNLPLRENEIDILEPEHADFTYGWCKLVGERLAEEMRAEGIKVVVLRPFSGWADDQSASYPMGAYLDRARRHADPFEIWGNGTQTRDFIHIDDIIATAMAAVEAHYTPPLNVCSGVGTDFNELAEMVTSYAGYHPTISYQRDMPTGVQYRVGDPTNMHKLWTPRFGLEERLKQALHVEP